MLLYDGTGPDTYVNVVCVDGKLREVTASVIGLKIKAVVDKIGVKRLGFTHHDVGTHSIRTLFVTMLSYLKVDPTLIMLNGRWKSDSVLRYIRTDIISPEIITHALQDKTHTFNTIKLISTLIKPTRIFIITPFQTSQLQKFKYISGLHLSPEMA